MTKQERNIMHAQETQTLTEAEAGCWLDGGLRGHYMSRDVIQLAQGFGFIVDGLAGFAVDAYDDHWAKEGLHYPLDELIELSHEAVEWLNSGQGECNVCFGRGEPGWSRQVDWTRVAERDERPCRVCSRTGRGPRIHGQNFPPRIPDGYRWDFNDGDFGLYRVDEDGEVLS